MTADDWDRLREYLKQFGELDPQFKYIGTQPLGTGQARLHRARRAEDSRSSPSELLKSKFMLIMSFGETDDQAAMMMEPVGGMDRVVAGFLRKIGHLVQLESQVQRIRVQAKGVEVTYRRDGEYVTAKADYVLNCIPMHLLAGIEHNFPKDYAAGFTAIPRGKLFKIGLQMKERFWEKRRHLRRHFLDAAGHPAALVSGAWHPPPEGRDAGRVHVRSEAGEKFARLAPAERIKLAIAQGEKIHPGYGELRRNRRDRRVAPDEPHAGLRRAMGRSDVQAMVHDAADARRGSLPDGRPGELPPGMAGRRDGLGASRHRRHRRARAPRAARGGGMKRCQPRCGAIVALALCSRSRRAPSNKFDYCLLCHGANANGNYGIRAPKLSGMEPWYLARQLENFAAGVRGAPAEDAAGTRWVRWACG